MRNVSRWVRGVVVVCLLAGVVAPVEARPARWESARNMVSVAMKWIARAFGDGLVDPKPTPPPPPSSQGDGLVDPWPKP